jgi:peptidoglycan/xylan/chitin deacetylase (PgdA/CDA1 family)
MPALSLLSVLRRLWGAEKSASLQRILVIGAGAGLVVLGMGFFRDRVGRRWDFGEKVHLSFDDGADEAVTTALLTTLTHYHVAASFFEEGSHLEQLPTTAVSSWRPNVPAAM